MRELLEDPARAAIVAVAPPEEMPVTETLELEERVSTTLGRDLDAVVVNGVRPRRFRGAELARIDAAGDRVPSGAREAVRRGPASWASSSASFGACGARRPRRS